MLKVRKPLLPEWRYWPGVMLAALIAVAVFGSLSSWSGSPREPTSTAQEDHSSNYAEDHPPSFFFAIGAWVTEDRDVILAVATALLAVVTAILVWVAYLQFATSRAQLRAYVSASPNFVVAFDANSLPAAKCKIFNHGPTPAFRVRHRSEIEILAHPYKKGMSLPKPSSGLSPPVSLFPGAEFTGSKTRATPFTLAEITQIRNGDVRIYVYGELEYFDIFGRRWTTTFSQAVIADPATLKKLTSLYKPSDLKITFESAPMGNSAT